MGGMTTATAFELAAVALGAMAMVVALLVVAVDRLLARVAELEARIEAGEQVRA